MGHEEIDTDTLISRNISQHQKKEKFHNEKTNS